MASVGGGPAEVRQNYWGNMPEEEFYASNGVRNSKAFVKTREGTLFTQEFLPLGEGVKPRGIVCLVHGYTSDTGWMFQSICLEMVKWGYAAFAADMLGHGRSDGLHGYVPSVDKVHCTALTCIASHRIALHYTFLHQFAFKNCLLSVYSIHIEKSGLTFGRLWKLQCHTQMMQLHPT